MQQTHGEAGGYPLGALGTYAGDPVRFQRQPVSAVDLSPIAGCVRLRAGIQRRRSGAVHRVDRAELPGRVMHRASPHARTLLERGLVARDRVSVIVGIGYYLNLGGEGLFGELAQRVRPAGLRSNESNCSARHCKKVR